MTTPPSASAGDGSGSSSSISSSAGMSSSPTFVPPMTAEMMAQAYNPMLQAQILNAYAAAAAAAAGAAQAHAKAQAQAQAASLREVAGSDTSEVELGGQHNTLFDTDSSIDDRCALTCVQSQGVVLLFCIALHSHLAE